MLEAGDDDDWYHPARCARNPSHSHLVIVSLESKRKMCHELRLLLVRRMGRQYAAIVAGGADCVASMMREWVLVRR